MAYGMAIGWLFLSGGRATFTRTPAAVAALLCSCYPRFPASFIDNRYHLQVRCPWLCPRALTHTPHLQALRHLYVLAVEPRGLHVRDATTGEEVYCPVDVQVRRGRGTAAMRLTAPCLLPELSTIASVSVQCCK